MKKNNAKISYEPEADVLRIEVAKRPLCDTVEMGDFVVSLDKNNQPIFVEILEARAFLLKSNQAILEKLPLLAAA